MFAYYSFDATMLVDFAFHIWGIVSISIGLSAHSKMKNLPAEEFFAPPAEDPEAEESDSATPMRPCDHIEDENVLIKYDLFGSEVIYLKTKKAYQLIIDGQIYCEIISRLQKKNNMTARFKGYTVEVGYNGLFYYVSVNGNIIYRKAKLN